MSIISLYKFYVFIDANIFVEIIELFIQPLSITCLNFKVRINTTVSDRADTT